MQINRQSTTFGKKFAYSSFILKSHFTCTGSVKDIVSDARGPICYSVRQQPAVFSSKVEAVVVNGNTWCVSYTCWLALFSRGYTKQWPPTESMHIIVLSPALLNNSYCRFREVHLCQSVQKEMIMRYARSQSGNFWRHGVDKSCVPKIHIICFWTDCHKLVSFL